MPKVAIIGDAPAALRRGFADAGWKIAEFRPGENTVPDVVAGVDLVVEVGPDRAAFKQKMLQLVQANVPAGVPVLVLSELGIPDLRLCAIRPEDIHRVDPTSLTVDGAELSNAFVQPLSSSPA